MALEPPESEATWREFGAAWRRSTVSLAETLERHYEAHNLAIYRYLCMLGVQPEIAEELCQECFLRLFHALRDSKRINAIRVWLLSVAHNLALNWLAIERGRQRYQALWLDGLVEQCADQHPSPEQQVIEHERFKQVNGALQALSPQQRACLCLRAEGLRYREIAEVIGISIPSVQQFLRRAIERLKGLHL